MRICISFVVLCLLVTNAPAMPLQLVHVSADKVYRMFDADGSIVVNDFTDDFGVPGATGQGRLLSRRFPIGQRGTAGAGVYAYLYRLDLRTLVENEGDSCIDAFRIDFGPIVPLDYNGNGTLDHGFVISRGSTATVTPTAADQIGDTITFRFSSPLCPAQGSQPGEDSFFFGLASRQAAIEVSALLRTTSSAVPTAVARAPMLPVEVNCDAGQSLGEALRKASPGAIIHVTGTCHEAITIPAHRIAVVGIGRTAIVGNRTQPVITMDRLSSIVLKNLTVQGGLHGIRVTGGRDITLVGVQAEHNAADGMQFLDAAQVRCADCSALANGNHGFIVRNNANVTFFGQTDSLSNLGHGMRVLDGISSFASNDMMLLSLFTCDAKMSRNGYLFGDGLWVDRTTKYPGFIFSPDCQFTAQENKGHGIRLSGGAIGQINEATVLLQCNGQSGMSVQGSSGVLSEGSKIRAKKNKLYGIHASVTAYVELDFDDSFVSALKSRVCSIENTLNGLKLLNSATFDCDPDGPDDPSKAEVSLQPKEMIPPGCVSKLPPAWCTVALPCSAP